MGASVEASSREADQPAWASLCSGQPPNNSPSTVVLLGMRGRYITPHSRRPISMLMDLICSHPFLSRTDQKWFSTYNYVWVFFLECVVSPSCEHHDDDLELPPRTGFASACRRPVAAYYPLKLELILRLFISADGSDYRWPVQSHGSHFYSFSYLFISSPCRRGGGTKEEKE